MRVCVSVSLSVCMPVPSIHLSVPECLCERMYLNSLTNYSHDQPWETKHELNLQDQGQSAIMLFRKILVTGS